MTIINPKTRQVSLEPFQFNGKTFKVTGTRIVYGNYLHSVKCLETGEYKWKEHNWIEQVNERIKHI